MLELWMKYLQKIQIAFLKKSNVPNENPSPNIQTERDKRYFEILKLKQEFDVRNKESDTMKLESFHASDLVWPEFFESEKNENQTFDDSELKATLNEKKLDTSIESSDEEFEKHDVSDEAESKKSVKLIKFDCALNNKIIMTTLKIAFNSI